MGTTEIFLYVGQYGDRELQNQLDVQQTGMSKQGAPTLQLSRIQWKLDGAGKQGK